MRSLFRFRKLLMVTGGAILLFWVYPALEQRQLTEVLQPPGTRPPPSDDPPSESRFNWADVPQHYPPASIRPLPKVARGSLPRVQAAFKPESPQDRGRRLQRRNAVLGNFTHAWKGYKTHAWLHDEVGPISGGKSDPFGGWAATLVDSLDTLWIMGLHDEFDAAVNAIDQIDFTTCSLDEINVFETTIRYLGGFLAAYDISGGKYKGLLRKAEEMGTMLYKAFDTPNRMPITRWSFKAAAQGARQVASDNVLVAEIGSLTLEFTRLSQLTGEPKYFDAVQRVMDVFDDQQDRTKIPGLWPMLVNAKTATFTDYGGFTIGGMADSLFEYLPKQHILLGGATNQYRKLYENALISMKRNIFYRPMTPDSKDILFAGQGNNDDGSPVEELDTQPEAQHLGCFAGGMVGLAARIFGDVEEMKTARQLMEGCLWGYESMSQGVLPEIIETVPCETEPQCSWDEQKWIKRMEEVHYINGKEEVAAKVVELGLTPGVVRARDKRYILRPEAIESVFILYRLEGDYSLQDRAWNMFNTIIGHTLTDIAHAELSDCTISDPPKSDRMESFWMAETLKYFYLIFSEPELVSLDEFVLNTEAHPLRRSV